MSGAKVYLLDLGTMELSDFALYWGAGSTDRIRFPVFSVLIDHPEGKFLFDTGFDKAFVDQLMPGNAMQTRRQTLEGGLDLIGLRPRDITHVINSHYHIDHVGGNKLCTHATTVCHACELETARNPEPWEALGYSDTSFAPGLRGEPQTIASVGDGRADDIYTPRFETLTGDQELAKGVHLFETPGHTPGHYSLMVRLQDRRPMLFAGDACYTKRSLQDNLIASTHSDVKQSFSSLQRLRDLAIQHDAEIFYGHDPDAWKTWLTAPGYYS